jgi:hypothetical protein
MEIIMMTTVSGTVKPYFTVKQLPLHYPAFTENSIRWLIFHEKTNGFFRCVRRIGRKVLIYANEFEAWIAKQGGANHE